MAATKGSLKTVREKYAEHTPEKPRLLFIDYAVPQYDVYAGSRTNFMYLEMLVEMGFDVIFLAGDFHPLEPYTSELQQLGIETLVGDWYRNNWESWLRDNGASLDFVFFHKPDPAASFLPAVKRHSKAATIYQCHDLHYLRLRRKAEVENDPRAAAEADEYERKEDFIFANCDVLLTFSEVEEKIIREKCPDKPVFTVPLFFYRDVSGPKQDFDQRQGLVYVGGCAHTPNHDALSWFCSEIFPSIHKQVPEIVLYVVGAEPPEDILAFESEHIRIMGRVSDQQLQALYANVRMMVVPLRFGAGVKGKVIETMHNGLPFVSTSIGLEGIRGIEWIASPRDSAEDFADEVVSVYGNTDRLRDLSLLGAQFVDANFSMKHTMSLMSRVFLEAKEQAQLNKSKGLMDLTFPPAGKGGEANPVSAVDDSDTSASAAESAEESQARLAELQGQISELETLLAQRQQQIDEIYQSTSWKLSAPLRWVKQILSGSGR